MRGVVVVCAVDAPANKQKGAGDAATWLPANRGYWCPYVARQVAVKAKYGLWVTAAERSRIESILRGCAEEPVPTSDQPVLAPEGLGVVPADQMEPDDAAQTPAPEAPEAPDTEPQPAPDSSLDPRFPFCSNAKAAGYGPYVQGVDGEYDWYRDADRDGVVCE